MMSFLLTIRMNVLLLGWLLLGLTPSAWADLNILASIKPLVLIAQEVVGEQGKVAMLLPITASPHDYPLRVSDLRKLQAADLVLWVGPAMETFLQRPLANISAEKKFTSYDLEGLRWPADGHSHGSHKHAQDPHLWLDPHNAIVVARALAAQLGKLQPEQAKLYATNAQRFSARIEALDKQLMTQLEPAKNIGFAVYHEGYQHFVSHFGLLQLGYVTYSPERRPGAKHMYQLRKNLHGKAECLFVEPYYDQHKMRELSEELDLRLGTLDPIGSASTQTYDALLQDMTEALLACLIQS